MLLRCQAPSPSPSVAGPSRRGGGGGCVTSASVHVTNRRGGGGGVASRRLRVGERSGRGVCSVRALPMGGSAAARKTEVEEVVEQDIEEEVATTDEEVGRSRGQYRGEEDGVASGADAARALRTLELPKLTNEDAYFAKLGTDFVFGQRPDVDLEELNALFAAVGFMQRDPVRLQRALVNSHHLVWVLVRPENKQRAFRPGQCVGFARAVSDEVFNGTIWDVVVSPAWQGCGIGRGMVERLVRRLVSEDIANVSLYSDPGVTGLYIDCGFEADPGGTTGMAFRQQHQYTSAPPGARTTGNVITTTTTTDDDGSWLMELMAWGDAAQPKGM